jgi:CRP-like cAMP-binding protein
MPGRLRKSEKIAIVEDLPLFETCTRKELGEVAAIMVEAERRAGTLLTREGREGGLMFVIVEGRAEILAGGTDRKAKVIGTLGPGDVVGELSLIDGKVRSASVRAVTDVRVLELAADDFERLFTRSPKFVRNLLRALSLRVRQMEALTT